MRRLSAAMGAGNDVPLTDGMLAPYSGPEQACEGAHGVEAKSAPLIPRAAAPGAGGDECILNFDKTHMPYWRQYIAACVMGGGAMI
jgi:hypothetical protein